MNICVGGDSHDYTTGRQDGIVARLGYQSSSVPEVLASGSFICFKISARVSGRIREKSPPIRKFASIWNAFQ